MTRAAEECAMLLARFIAPDRTVQVLLPMIDAEEYPINLAAIKMMTQLIENSGSDAIVEFLPEIIPVLLKVSVGFHTYVPCFSAFIVWQPHRAADMSMNWRQSFFCCCTRSMEQAAYGVETAAIDGLVSS